MSRPFSKRQNRQNRYLRCGLHPSTLRFWVQNTSRIQGFKKFLKDTFYLSYRHYCDQVTIAARVVDVVRLPLGLVGPVHMQCFYYACVYSGWIPRHVVCCMGETGGAGWAGNM